MTDEQRQRVHDITYSTQDREELAERIVALEDERDKLRMERDLYSALVEDMDHPDTANQLRSENAKLQDENARLRSCLSDDAENARQTMGENAKLRELASELYQQVLQDDAAWRDVRAWEDSLPSDCLHPIRSYDDSLGKYTAAPKFKKRMRELGIEAEDA